MRACAAALLLAACAHPKAPAAQLSGPSRGELAKVSVRVAPETVVNDPVLADRGAQLRSALSKALAGEGFRVVEQGPALVATTSIDYTPWTALNAASLYIVVALKNEGESVDQVEVQKVNEAFPEPEKVPDLARSLAHALATSPRLRDYLAPK